MKNCNDEFSQNISLYSMYLTITNRISDLIDSNYLKIDTLYRQTQFRIQDYMHPKNHQNTIINEDIMISIKVLSLITLFYHNASVLLHMHSISHNRMIIYAIIYGVIINNSSSQNIINLTYNLCNS